MNLSEKAEIGIIDEEKGIAIARKGSIRKFWFTKLKAKDFRR